MAKKSRPRDSQRSRIYKAETPLPGGRLPQLADCSDFIHSVLESPWWQGWCEHGTLPKLRPGYGARQAFFHWDREGPTITLPRRYRTKGVLLHELCHYALWKQTDLPDHGSTFARVYIDATEHVMGTERAEKLAGQFAEHRVRVGAPARKNGTGKWHYGWDERLRLAADRPVIIQTDIGAFTGSVVKQTAHEIILSERSGQLVTMDTADIQHVQMKKRWLRKS